MFIVRVVRVINRDHVKIEVTNFRCREREEVRSPQVQLARNSPRSLNTQIEHFITNSVNLILREGNEFISKSKFPILKATEDTIKQIWWLWPVAEPGGAKWASAPYDVERGVHKLAHPPKEILAPRLVVPKKWALLKKVKKIYIYRNKHYKIHVFPNRVWCQVLKGCNDQSQI